MSDPNKKPVLQEDEIEPIIPDEWQQDEEEFDYDDEEYEE